MEAFIQHHSLDGTSIVLSIFIDLSSLVRLNLSITPGSANLEILIKKTHKKNTQKITKTFG